MWQKLSICCIPPQGEQVAIIPLWACGDECCSEDQYAQKPRGLSPAPGAWSQRQVRCRSCVGLGRLYGDACDDCGGTGTVEPNPLDPTAEETLDGGAASLEAVVAALPAGACRVCVLGATLDDGYEQAGGEELVATVARRFGSALAGRTVVLTCGLPGTQATFARSLGPAFPAIVHMLPTGVSSRFGVGRDLPLSAGLQERRSLFARLGHVFLVFEGGPDVAEAALSALASGALVIPIANAAGGAAGFPLAVLRRPDVAGEAEWQTLIHGDLPEVVAEAVIAIIQKYIVSHGSILASPTPPPASSRNISRQSGAGDRAVRSGAWREALQLFRSAHLYEAAELLTRTEAAPKNTLWWEQSMVEIGDPDLQLLAFIYGGLTGLLLRVADREGLSHAPDEDAVAGESRDRQVLPVGSERVQQMSMHIAQSTDEMKAKGWEDCSPHEEGIDMLTFVQIDFDAKRTFMTSTSVMPHSFDSILPLFAEIDLAQEWFPFVTTSKVLHRWSDSVFLVQAVATLPVISFELIFVTIFEDHFDEAGCFGIYLVSPPTDVLFQEENVSWMGAEIPAANTGRFSWRVPLADARMLYFPISEEETRVRCEVAEIHIITPVTWITHFFYTQVSKRINPLIAYFLETTADRLRERVEARPSFYERWFAPARRQMAKGG